MTYHFDTNHAIAHLNGDPRLLSHLNAAQSTAVAFAINTTVLGELYYGAYASRRSTDNVTRLAAFVGRLVLIEFDAAAAQEFGRIKAEQRVKGKPIPTADAQIAAVARIRGLTVLTNDAHFQFVGNLSIANWLT